MGYVILCEEWGEAFWRTARYFILQKKLTWPHFNVCVLTQLLDNLIVTQLVNKFSAFYGTLSFIIIYTKSGSWTSFGTSSIQFIPSHTHNFPKCPPTHAWTSHLFSFLQSPLKFCMHFYLAHACFISPPVFLYVFQIFAQKNKLWGCMFIQTNWLTDWLIN
jgi:hypothetical protein